MDNISVSVLSFCSGFGCEDGKGFCSVVKELLFDEPGRYTCSFDRFDFSDEADLYFNYKVQGYEYR